MGIKLRALHLNRKHEVTDVSLAVYPVHLQISLLAIEISSIKKKM